jgi:hypothetical protein
MPFYIRKSVNIGPFRFNLSGSGIGVSAGVRGFRIGTGPHGHYIHAGTDGFYYRSSLRSHTPPRTGKSQLPMPRQPGVGPHLPVETGNITEMVDADAATVLKSINENFAKIGVWPIPLLVLFPLIPLPGAGPAFAALAVSIAAILVGLTFWLYRRDNTRFTTVLMYDLDDAAIKVFEKFTTEFDDLSQSQKAINIDTKGVVYDWKRHAGAAFEVKSGPAQFGYGMPRRIQTNVSIPFIRGGLICASGSNCRGGWGNAFLSTGAAPVPASGRFVDDSPLEETGFEPLVPLATEMLIEFDIGDAQVLWLP